MLLRSLFLALAGLSLIACGGGGGGDDADTDTSEPRVLSPVGIAGTEEIRLFNSLPGKSLRLSIGTSSTEGVSYGAVSASRTTLQGNTSRIIVTEESSGIPIVDQVLSAVQAGDSYTIYAYGTNPPKIASSQNAVAPFAGSALFRIVNLLEEAATTRGVLRYGAESINFIGGPLSDEPISYIAINAPQPFTAILTFEDTQSFLNIPISRSVSFKLAQNQPRTLVIYGSKSNPRFTLLRD